MYFINIFYLKDKKVATIKYDGGYTNSYYYYDKEKEIWLSTSARDILLQPYPYIKRVPVIAAFKPTSLSQITGLINKTEYQSSDWKKHLELKCEMLKLDYPTVLKETEQSGLMEGVYIKHEDNIQVINRYKFVRYEFLQSILESGTHLIDRPPIYNSLAEVE